MEPSRDDLDEAAEELTFDLIDSKRIWSYGKTIARRYSDMCSLHVNIDIRAKVQYTACKERRSSKCRNKGDLSLSIHLRNGNQAKTTGKIQKKRNFFDFLHNNGCGSQAKTIWQCCSFSTCEWYTRKGMAINVNIQL
jgi:hypothetical protein